MSAMTVCRKALMQCQMARIDYSQLMNIPGVQVFNMADMEQSIPKQQKIKKKKEGEEYKPLVDIKNLPAPHKIKAKLDEYVVGQNMQRKLCL